MLWEVKGDLENGITIYDCNISFAMFIPIKSGGGAFSVRLGGGNLGVFQI